MLSVNDYYALARSAVEQLLEYIPIEYLTEEDVIQDLVIDLWEKDEAGRIPNKAYAFKTCKNKLRDMMRAWRQIVRGPRSWTSRLDAEEDEELGYTQEQFLQDVQASEVLPEGHTLHHRPQDAGLVREALEWARVGEYGPLAALSSEAAQLLEVRDRGDFDEL